MHPTLLVPSGSCSLSPLPLFSVFFSLFEEKVDDIPSTYPQPWPFSTLPQTFLTSLIILLSLHSVPVGFWDGCPPVHLNQRLDCTFHSPLSKSMSLLRCTAMFYGWFGSPQFSPLHFLSDQESSRSFHLKLLTAGNWKLSTFNTMWKQGDTLLILQG